MMDFLFYYFLDKQGKYRSQIRQEVLVAADF